MMKIMKLILLLILTICIVFFSHWKNSERLISSFSVNFYGIKNNFIDKQMVNKLLKQNKFSKSTLKKDIVVLDSIERVLKDLPEIKNVNVFAYPEGKIGIDIEERKPVLRIINGNKSYFLDEDGFEIPFTGIYSPRIPIFFGKLSNENKNGLINFFNSINDNKFFKNEIIEIKYYASFFVLRLRSFDFEVNWGTNKNFKDKVFKLEKFCNYILAQDKKNHYSKIDVTINNRIIATHL